jgi:hypothetical protein
MAIGVLIGINPKSNKVREKHNLGPNLIYYEQDQDGQKAQVARCTE